MTDNEQIISWFSKTLDLLEKLNDIDTKRGEQIDELVRRVQRIEAAVKFGHSLEKS